MKTRSDIKVIWVLIVWTVVNIAGFALAFYAVSRDFSGSLPWITGLVGVFDGAVATVLNKDTIKSQAENTAGGITYEAAKAKNFERDL